MSDFEHVILQPDELLLLTPKVPLAAEALADIATTRSTC